MVKDQVGQGLFLQVGLKLQLRGQRAHQTIMQVVRGHGRDLRRTELHGLEQIGQSLFQQEQVGPNLSLQGLLHRVIMQVGLNHGNRGFA